MPDSARVTDLLHLASERLRESDSAQLDAQILLCHCLNKERSYLHAWPEAIVPGAVRDEFMQLLARREKGEPIAYLTGHREFWSLSLRCRPSTLIPRPDTETLVETALSLTLPQAAHVLDLGSGTGAIALALASERAQWQIQACDLADDAVALAEQNRCANSLDNVRVYQSDWFSQVEEGGFHLIVSNPPYIDEADPHLGEGDLRYEPRSALVAGNQGYAAIETIASEAPDHLLSGGWLLLEHGFDQAERVRQLLQLSGYRHVQSWRDLGGHERVTGGQR